jgi:hypothetical protein
MGNTTTKGYLVNQTIVFLFLCLVYYFLVGGSPRHISHVWYPVPQPQQNTVTAVLLHVTSVCSQIISLGP